MSLVDTSTGEVVAYDQTDGVAVYEQCESIERWAAECDSVPSGRCEWAQLVDEEAAERREMAGRFPCGEFAPHAAHECPECRRAFGLRTVA